VPDLIRYNEELAIGQRMDEVRESSSMEPGK